MPHNYKNVSYHGSPTYCCTVCDIDETDKLAVLSCESVKAFNKEKAALLKIKEDRIDEYKKLLREDFWEKERDLKSKYLST